MAKPKGTQRKVVSVKNILESRATPAKKVEQLFNAALYVLKTTLTLQSFASQNSENASKVEVKSITDLKAVMKSILSLVKSVLSTKARSVTSVVQPEFVPFVKKIASRLAEGVKIPAEDQDRNRFDIVCPVMLSNSDREYLFLALDAGRPVLKQLVRSMINLWTTVEGIHQKTKYTLAVSKGERKVLTTNFYAPGDSADSNKLFVSGFIRPAINALAAKGKVGVSDVLAKLKDGQKVSAAIVEESVASAHDDKLQIVIRLPTSTGGAFQFPTRTLTSLTAVIFDPAKYKKQIAEEIHATSDKARRAEIRARHSRELAELSTHFRIAYNALRRTIPFVNTQMPPAEGGEL